MSLDQNAARSHKMKFVNTFFESVEEFRYLVRSLTYQNSVQEEFKSRLKLGNACCHSEHNRLSSSVLSKNLNINTLRTGDAVLRFYITTVQDG